MAKVSKDDTTEERILQAARKVFIREGLAGARMQDIADEAGINKAMLHYYFRSKDKLFETIFAEVAGRFLPQVNAILNSDLSLFQKIEAFCVEYLDNVAKNPFIPLFVINEMNRQPKEFLKKLFRNDKPKFEKFFIQLNDAIRKKQVRAIDPFDLLINTVSLCVFPFLAKPLFQLLSGANDSQFKALIEERKRTVPALIINSIKP
jgi:TetR/AcrR family transcriptional regulator